MNIGYTKGLTTVAGARGRSHDYPEAQRLYQLAADAGDTNALPVLAEMFERAGDLAS